MEKQQTSGILDEFQNDLMDCWRRLPDKALFFILLAAWLLLFQFVGSSTMGYIKTPSLFRWMYNAYQPSPITDDAHGQVIPFVVLALFWWKRKELMSVPFQNWWPGLFIIAFSLALHVVGYLTMQARISIIALFTGMYGLMGLVWGREWLRASFFPFFLFAFCVPLGSLGQAVTTPLRHLVAIIVTWIAHVGIAPDLIREGTQLSDAQNSFHYDIAPACSGIRSLIALLALTTIYAFISFRSNWRRLLMMASAIPLAVIGNVVRLTFTVIVAEAFGQSAGSKVEQKFGFVTFAVAIVLVVLIGNWLNESKAKPPLPLEVKPA